MASGVEAAQASTANAGSAAALRLRSGTSAWQIFAFALTALSLLCVAGYGASRMLAMRRRSPNGQERVEPEGA
jgi:hypothetical protein